MLQQVASASNAGTCAHMSYASHTLRRTLTLTTLHSQTHSGCYPGLGYCSVSLLLCCKESPPLNPQASASDPEKVRRHRAVLLDMEDALWDQLRGHTKFATLKALQISGSGWGFDMVHEDLERVCMPPNGSFKESIDTPHVQNRNHKPQAPKAISPKSHLKPLKPKPQTPSP